MNTTLASEGLKVSEQIRFWWVTWAKDSNVSYRALSLTDTQIIYCNVPIDIITNNSFYDDVSVPSSRDWNLTHSPWHISLWVHSNCRRKCILSLVGNVSFAKKIVKYYLDQFIWNYIQKLALLKHSFDDALWADQLTPAWGFFGFAIGHLLGRLKSSVFWLRVPRETTRNPTPDPYMWYQSVRHLSCPSAG